MAEIKSIKKRNKKIHISYFIGSLGLGGTEKQLIKLLNSLDKNQFKIDLHLLDERGDLFEELDNTIKVYLPKFKFRLKLKHLLNFIWNWPRLDYLYIC